ncbi:ABC transporter permease subunit [Sulfitobacter sp. JBTF-M27]|uniref:ABC transporter permease subunit n=1 Tax=Sulfitobacter sediminilitoris TaxID=2698830 RepID=A0A6P0CIV4_9RHOB|nr:ABC transporter permease [Sulfitobacter sediminilitoris]NEK24443.1 ABC transporter permease subunit [Sulfitobacter sediminilitoris]
MTAVVDPQAVADPLPPRRRNRAWEKFRRSPSALLGGAIVLFFLIVALLAPLLPVPGPTETDWSAVRKAPSAAHLFGTDEIGRDVLSRMIWGAQASLLAGVVSVLIAVLLGVPLGMLAGYMRGWTDAIISRFTEALLAAPFLILAIALAAFLGPSLTNAMIAIGLSAMPIFIRLARAQTLSVMTEDYVESARAVGIGHLGMIGRYILPNIIPPIIVQATLTIATAIIAEASLSFLGLGQQPPAPSWGAMLNIAKNFLEQAPWMALYPGVAIFLVVLGFNLLGDGLRDALDPRDN